MEDALRNILIGVATSLSVASIGVGINTYVDVQILKSTQAEQGSIVNTTREILNRIDKTQAVQSETIKTLSDLVNNLNQREKHK
ncbi:virion structural protein [Cronobacter phage A24]|uniref:Uncharacterized protein n=2 Tax=Crifsvirus TaxID=3044695 RepID=A0A7T5UFC9_9CAUD|nr:virion structural protein [Cronobacter phage vB_CsaP_GAP52]YP_010671889.1 virion structural protein [Cronobacter phage A24]AFC22011.1 hypothetical protein GAP52_018A [Cronobacter phage vB_CsaP_GAP52]QQG33641.1 hypothetical protein [Cronobacter phage A24]WAX14253.1 hypothetical protein ECO319P1_00094 [Escherichia phage ECO319P1]